jgi:hypothetical protein
MLCYDNAMELRRRPWQRRIEVYSPKIQRRLTLFSRDAHDAWLLLEADPEVRTFCERPAANRRLQEEIFARVEKPYRLEHLEAAFQPIDVSLVRASLFKLVAEGRVVATDIDVVPLGSTTVFRRSAS